MASNIVIYLSALLFCCGFVTVLMKRNAIFVLMGIELMLNAANLNLVVFNRMHAQQLEGQFLALFTILIAVCEAAIGIAIIIKVYHFYQSSVPDQANQLHEKL